MSDQVNLNDARELAEALRNAMPVDPVNKAKWIHSMRVLRDMLGDEIPAMDTGRWEQLCYPLDA